MVEMKAKALGFDTLLQGVGLAYLLVFVIVLAVVLAKGTSPSARLKYGALVIGLFALLPYRLLFYESPEQKEYRQAQEAKQAEWRTKFEKGKALFDEKCKTAGERIYRTVENVEGVLLLKLREERGSNSATLNNHMWPDAALADEFSGDTYIQRFLTDRKEIVVSGYQPNQILGRRIVGDVDSPGAEQGLRYVDVIEPVNGQRYRVTATAIRRPGYQPEIKLAKQLTTAALPRYAVTFENNVDPELRKYWVAGTTIRVVDTTTNLTLGELEVWRFGPTMGVDTQGTGWGTSVKNCPDPPYRQYGEQTHYFVQKLLKAKQRE